MNNDTTIVCGCGKFRCCLGDLVSLGVVSIFQDKRNTSVLKKKKCLENGQQVRNNKKIFWLFELAKYGLKCFFDVLIGKKKGKFSHY